MSFASVLESYCASLNCTNAVIAERCGLSASSLSRYRNGNRAPASTDTILDLARGISELSLEPGAQKELSQSDVAMALEAARKGLYIVGAGFGERLDRIMTAMDIRNGELAVAAQVDPSYISRIRSGERTPADRRHFARACAVVAAHRSVYEGAIDRISSFIPEAAKTVRVNDPGLDLESMIADDIMMWLLGNKTAQDDIAETRRLFDWMEHFDFSSYIEALSAPYDIPVPDLTPRAQFRYGLEDMSNADLEFLDIAAYTHAPAIYLTSDLPLFEMTVGADFQERFLRSVGRLTVNGTHVYVAHNAERSLAESLIIIRDWLPLYMTGNVTPYYLQGPSNRVFCHVNYVCDSCAISAEAVMGHQWDGRYYFTLKKEDIDYYRRKMGFIMERSSSLFEVFLGNRNGDFERFQESERDRAASGTGREVCAGMYENIRIVSYPGDCEVISLSGNLPAHFVVRHPKLRYAISSMN